MPRWVAVFTKAAACTTRFLLELWRGPAIQSLGSIDPRRVMPVAVWTLGEAVDGRWEMKMAFWDDNFDLAQGERRTTLCVRMSLLIDRRGILKVKRRGGGIVSGSIPFRGGLACSCAFFFSRNLPLSSLQSQFKGPGEVGRLWI